jgi:glycosyltransferase involved in cell wall biosynthesis
MFAWHWETKGGPLLLDTVQELRRRGIEVHAIVVGSVSRARDAAACLGLQDVVHTRPPMEDPRVLYGAADVFVAASFSEGMPFALLEAAACQTPVVASDIPGHRFAGAALPACRLVPRLPGAFADAIASELAAGTQDRATRVMQSRALIERDFSLESWSHRLLELYDQVLA